MKLLIENTTKINPLPWLTDQAIDFLEDLISCNKEIKILEFGSGGSTLWFAKKNNVELVSIEHDENWYKKVSDELKEKSLNIDYRLIKRNYFEVCDEFPDEHFDLVLVDAKDRIDCIKKAIRVLKKGAILMLDNAERPKFQIAHEILKGWPCTITTQVGKSRLGFEQENWQTKWWQKPF